MEGLYIQATEEDEVMMEHEEQEKSREQDEGRIKACSPAGSTEEEADEDSEPEPPPIIRRKVSFADAFGLNLVSVKEFDNAEVTDSEMINPPEMEETLSSEEFYMSCLFTVPSSPEELDQHLELQMIELESIELLPRSTTLRGIIRVVNLCYNKWVYARITVDRWNSYFDLLAEYVPGSSDRKTDRFTFTYTFVPPFEREGTRVEFCLRYETSVGTFWANNREMNYVLFFHQKEHVKDHGPRVQEESTSYKNKRSCLKANRRGSAEEKTRDTINPTSFNTEVADRKTLESTEILSLLCCEERKPLVDSLKSKHRATRMARVRDHYSQRRQHLPEAYSHDLPNGQKVSEPISSLWDTPACLLHNHPTTQRKTGLQVLTYHQIPLLTLDWSDDKPQQWGAADVDDIWTEGAKMALSKASEENMEETASVNDIWEAFLNGTDETSDKETSVCDGWQAFLNGPSFEDHSGVPESEWLQTAASVSPSNDKEPRTQCAASSQVHEFQVGKDTPNNFHAHTSSACQPLSDTCETSLANVALNTEDHQPAEACVSSPGDDNTATLDASQRSQTNYVTETVQEFSLMGAMPVAKGSVDSSSECHKHEIWEQERERIIGGAEGIGGDEPFIPHTADLVTSSGESETTDMTAKPQSQNASAVDRISQGARLDEGLSYSREGEVTGTTHNTVDDTLAFKETIRQGTQDGERFVFFTFRQEVEEGITINCRGNKESREEEIFRPQKTEECQISQRYADEEQCQGVRLNRNFLEQNEQDENISAQSHATEFHPNQTCVEHFRQTMAKELKWDKSEREGVASCKTDTEVFRKAEVEPLYCQTSQDTMGLIGAKPDIIQVLKEDAWPHNDKASPCNLSVWQQGNPAVFSEMHSIQSKPIVADEMICIQKEIKEQESTLTQTAKDMAGDGVLVSKTEKGISLNCGEIIQSKETPPPSETKEELFPHTVGSLETKKAFQSNRNTFRSFPTDKCQQEVGEISCSHSQDDMKGHKEDVGCIGIGSEDVLKEIVAKKDTSTELQHQPETLERIEEDMSQRGKDERVRIEKLKIEAMGELMGNAENPQEESKNATAESEEQELSAEVESSPHVEYKKMSERTKDSIKAESTEAVEPIGSGLKMFLERFGEELVRKVWEEVFDQKNNPQALTAHTNVVDGSEGRRVEIYNTTDDCQLVRATMTSEKSFNETLDSGVFSMNCNDFSLNERGQSPNKTEETLFVFHSDTSAHLNKDLDSTLGTHSSPPSTKSAQSSPKDQEYSEIKERSVTHQEADSQTEDCVDAHRESCDRSAQSSHKHLSSTSKELKEADGVGQWNTLYILSHITRLLICAFLVSGSFLIFFLYDFPVFFALYAFSVCWWFYKWKRHQMVKHSLPPPPERNVECSTI
ncbi:uncharacterized protein ppp1r3aa isoform X2 [Sphaeramia orbicularis]|uniref:uncharacterized protein ppp1r3aa isoform X2 n=1 Tax=Sphaeramia orbicularis TaxID=375764 RepID=UPI00117E5DA9|nr:uncharacterized protein LOC115430692 isoform X2 [Sphaeramia orbicularis]